MDDGGALTAEQRGPLGQQGHPSMEFRLSWVAYLREVVAFAVRVIGLLLAGQFGTFLLKAFKMNPGYLLLILGVLAAIAWTVYSVALTKSVRLFTDDTGVWVQSGVLPWEKGLRGVQWRDIGQASYTQGFASWALRSYDVRVSHRFTTDAELYLRNVHRGNLAVEHINTVMARLQGSMFHGR